MTGVAQLPEGTEMVMPGDNVQLEVELITPVAMDKGLRFAIREGGRTVGAGTVTEIIRVSQESGVNMAREIITFQCTECKNRNYTNTKNKKTTTERLEMKKFCPNCRKHQPHKEIK